MRTRHHNDGLRKICACPRRLWLKCPHSWYFNFAWRGQHHRYGLDRIVGRAIRSKTEAVAEAERLRGEIRAGTFRPPGAPPAGPVLSTLTVAQLLETHARRCVAVERPAAVRHERWQAAVVCRTELDLPTGGRRAFGDWHVSDVTTDTIEAFRAARHAAGVVAANRNLAMLRACWNWAIRVGYLERTPFKRGSETVVRLSRELPRRRRLEGDEADRLLAACGAHLRALVEAALETGCRLGELLSLQWSQVRLSPRQALVLPAQKTKTKRERTIPVSSRLRAILDMRRLAPDGEPHPPSAYVFGNEIGQRVASIKTAWRLALRRAQIEDLHFHDLRREAGSRWLDGGVPLQTVRDWLGHANISQTSTYLESTAAGQHEAMARFDARRDLQGFANRDGRRLHKRTRATIAPNGNANIHAGEHDSV